METQPACETDLPRWVVPSLFGAVPALGFTGVILLGFAFGVRSPARLLAEFLVSAVWCAPTFYCLIVGGAAMSIVASMICSGEARGRLLALSRLAGWSGFVLLLICVPSLLFQLLFLLAEDA